MVKTIHSAIDRIASGWSFAAFGLIAVLTVATVNLADFSWTIPGFKQLTHGAGILDLEWHYDAEGAYRLLAAQGEAGRALYCRSLWTLDIVIPVAVSMWLAIAITLAQRRLVDRQQWARYLNLFPIVAGMSDLLENILVTILLSGYPYPLTSLANVAGYVTTAKHLLYQFSIILALIGWGLVVFRKKWTVGD